MRRRRQEEAETKLSIVRGGGLAGLVTRSELSSDDLSDDDSGLLKKRVEDSGLLTGSDAHADAASGSGADQFSYEVTVEHDDAAHTVRVAEGKMPEALESLISWVDNHAKTERQVERPTR